MKHVVRSLTSGPWRNIDAVDAIGNKIGERILVCANEEGRWCIDNRSVEVQPRMCVSFRDVTDAEYFLSQGRAALIAVEVGMLVWFESEFDAQFYVMRGLGELLSPREVEMLQAQIDADLRAQEDAEMAEAETGEEKMQDTSGLENKAAQKPAETKVAKPAKPASKGKK